MMDEAASASGKASFPDSCDSAPPMHANLEAAAPTPKPAQQTNGYCVPLAVLQLVIAKLLSFQKTFRFPIPVAKAGGSSRRPPGRCHVLLLAANLLHALLEGRSSWALLGKRVSWTEGLCLGVRVWRLGVRIVGLRNP